MKDDCHNVKRQLYFFFYTIETMYQRPAMYLPLRACERHSNPIQGVYETAKSRLYGPGHINLVSVAKAFTLSSTPSLFSSS